MPEHLRAHVCKHIHAERSTVLKNDKRAAKKIAHKTGVHILHTEAPGLISGTG